MRAGELPRQTIERLLAKEFGRWDLEIQGHSVEVEEAASESYGVTTKYIRTVFFATLGPEVELPTFTRPRNYISDASGEDDYKVRFGSVEYWSIDMSTTVA